MKKEIGDLTLRKIKEICDKQKFCDNCPLNEYCDGEPSNDDFSEYFKIEIEVKDNED